jgi:hypothetical protein
LPERDLRPYRRTSALAKVMTSRHDRAPATRRKAVAVTTSTTRVLIEHENPLIRQTQAATLEAAGFDVTTCGGPAAQPGGACPLVTDGYCYDAANADVIVDGLPLGHLRVYVTQRTHLDDGEVLLSLSEAERVRHPILAGVATCVPRNVNGAELVEAVREAAAKRAQPHTSGT